jgi:diadenylate cyclase
VWRELEKLRDLGNIAEVLILALLIFALLTFLRGTRGEGMLKTLAAVLAVSYLGLRTIALSGEFERLTLVLDAIFQASVIALVVIFQPELRRGLALKIGNRFLPSELPGQEIVLEVVNAAVRLSKTKIGALIVLERRNSLKAHVPSGTLIDAEVKAELLRSIFYVGTPLHDGAVIIQKGRVAAAGCFLPLTDNPAVPKALGTRHRAAIGLSEVEDALVLVVSEETGSISLAEAGILHRDLDREALSEMLDRLYLSPVEADDEDRAEATAPEGENTPEAGKGKTTSRVERRKVPS